MAEQTEIVTVSAALFASGSGSNAAALLDHRYADAVRPRFRCLIGNNSAAPVMALARERGVPTYHVSRHTHPNRDAYLARLTDILVRYDTRLIVLAGYMKLLPGAIVRRWRGRILNIHPALLPRHGGRGMYGLAPHRAVLAAGERETGVTVHLVDEEYDRGPVVLQRRVPVRPGDSAETLAQRVLAAEHDTYWRAVERLAGAVEAERQAAGNRAAAPGTRGVSACTPSGVPGAAPTVPRRGTHRNAACFEAGRSDTAAAAPESRPPAPEAPGAKLRRIGGAAPAERVREPLATESRAIARVGYGRARP